MEMSRISLVYFLFSKSFSFYQVLPKIFDVSFFLIAYIIIKSLFALWKDFYTTKQRIYFLLVLVSVSQNRNYREKKSATYITAKNYRPYGNNLLELELVLYRQYRQTVLCTLTLSIFVQNWWSSSVSRYSGIQWSSVTTKGYKWMNNNNMRLYLCTCTFTPPPPSKNEKK